MSIVSLATGDATCTIEDLNAVCAANNFSIESGSLNETAFLLFANSFDSVCLTIDALPDYEDPRLKPVEVEGGERTYVRPDAAENPLNAWMHRTNLVAADPASKEGPLAKRTFAVKDNVSVAGLPLGLGCSPTLLKDGIHPISPVDASIVRRILAAGGTIKGTATCENLSLFALSYTSDAGVVHNAWLPGHATGGSSSGCGALVSIPEVAETRKAGKLAGDWALGEGVDMGIGGDQGGSIRLPAAFSGIYGLKPTFGLVPYTGIASLNPMIDHTGPMARTLEDIALLLGVMAGYDGIDPRMTPESPMPYAVPNYLENLKSWTDDQERQGNWTPSSAAKGLRVGILKEAFEVASLDPNVKATVHKAAERFVTMGAKVQELSVPFHRQGAAIWSTAARPMMPHFLANKPPDQLAFPMPHLDPLPVDQMFFDTLAHRNPATVNVCMTAAHMERKYGSALSRKAMMHVFELRAAYDKAFEEVDVLLTPANATVSPPHPSRSAKTQDNPRGFSENIMDLMEPAIGSTLNTCPFNLTGHPAMSMPVGWGKAKDGDSRLPVGMQVIAKRFDEISILKAAKAWEVGGRWTDL